MDDDVVLFLSEGRGLSLQSSTILDLAVERSLVWVQLFFPEKSEGSPPCMKSVQDSLFEEFLKI